MKILKNIDDTDIKVRRKAAEALANSAGASRLPALIDIFIRADPYLKPTVKRVRDEADLEALIRAQDAVFTTRKQLAQGIWRIRESLGEPRIIVAKQLAPDFASSVESLRVCKCSSCQELAKRTEQDHPSDKKLVDAQRLIEMMLFFRIVANSYDFNIMSEQVTQNLISLDWSREVRTVHDRPLGVIEITGRKNGQQTFQVFRISPKYFGFMDSGQQIAPYWARYLLSDAQDHSWEKQLEYCGISDVILDSEARRCARGESAEREPVDAMIEWLTTMRQRIDYDETARNVAIKRLADSKDAGLGVTVLLNDLEACRSDLTGAAIRMVGAVVKMPLVRETVKRIRCSAEVNQKTPAPKLVCWMPDLWSFEDSRIKLAWTGGTAKSICEAADAIKGL